MKKLTVLLLVAALLLLTACSEGGASQPNGWNPLESTPSGGSSGSASSRTGDGPAAPASTQAGGSPAAPASTQAGGSPADPAPTQAGGSPSLPTPSRQPAETSAPTVNYTVRNADWTNVEWEAYSNPYFTLTVPKGWKVEWAGNAQQLEWSVKTSNGQVGVYNLDHNYAAKDPAMRQALGMRFALQYGTVREYFEMAYADSTQSFVVQNAVVPDNKAQLQASRPYTAIRDYQSLYATFVQDGLVGEGIYTAVIMESKDVYVSGRNYGLWEINCTFTEWSPQGELVNWLPILSQIAQSFAYTDYYVQEWKSVLNSSTTSPEGSVSDSVLDSFNERDRADTILQEKRSDMLGEYERVYDNETGEIYRAYLGFLDDLDAGQSRYTPITDDQYADGYAGYIEKP